MSCTVSPVTSTSVNELRDIRNRLNGVYNGLQSRTSTSANMSSSSGLIAANIHRGTKLTLPLVLTDTAEKLDVSGNTMLYTLKLEQTFILKPHLPIEYCSINESSNVIIMYSTLQTEQDKKVRYVVVVIVTAQILTSTASLVSDPARPDTIPLCPSDADFNKSIPATSIESLAGRAPSEDKNRITLSFFRSVDGGAFSSHTVTKYGWDIPSGTDRDKLLLTKLPSASESMSYPVDESKPYGYFFKKCRPPGFKKEWARVATKDYSLALMEAEAPRAVDICAVAKNVPNVEPLKNAIVNGSLVTLRHESGGLLYMPINLFDIRPQQGSSVARTNVVDPGPFPRKTPRGKRITTGYRTRGSTYYSAGGNYQYIQSTWEEYSKRYASMFGVTTGHKWVWEAPPHAQVWYQVAYMTENFHNNTSAVRDIFPPFYYAIMVHANNIGNSMSYKFLRAATRAIRRDRAITPGYDMTAAHITCKRVYEQKSWLIMKHNAYMNRVLDALKRELPLIDPALYPNNPTLYPRSL